MIRGFVSEYLNRVLDDRGKSAYAVPHSSYTAREIHDKSGATDAGDSPREHAPRKTLSARGPNGFGHAGGFPFQYCPGRLRSDVTRGKPSSPGREDNVGNTVIRPACERPYDQVGFVGHQFSHSQIEAGFANPVDDEVAGFILSLTRGPTV